jgi:hypothetical protein
MNAGVHSPADDLDVQLPLGEVAAPDGLVQVALVALAV